MQVLLRDARFALRQLRHSPGFAVTAVLTLGLGIGANTAIFSLLDQALLRSLPVERPNQIVVLEGTGEAWQGHIGSHGGDEEAYFSYPMYRDLLDQSRAFSGLIATSPAATSFAYKSRTSNEGAEIVSGNYFSTLGVQASLGRVIESFDDAVPGANPVVVLGFDFWANQLGAPANIVGKTVSINAHPYQVIGVAAPGFRSAIWGETPSMFVPMSMLDQILPGKGKRLTDHTDRWLNILGRLKPGESRPEAETSLAPLWHALRAEELKALGTTSRRFQAEFVDGSRLRLLPGAGGFSYQRDTYRKPLLMVMGMAILVLLIASVNVASLLLVRSASRVREFGIRFALGARTTQLVRQLLLESLLIGSVGGAAALAIAFGATRVLIDQISDGDPTSAFTGGLDHRVLFFNFAIALGVSVLFGIVPALQLRKPDVMASVRQQVTTGSGGALILRRLVICMQIGISVLLLVCAGLLVRTLHNLRNVDLGLNPTHLVTFGINPRLAGYSLGSYIPLNDRILSSLRSLPGVQSAGATSTPELATTDTGGNVTVAGYNAPADEDFSVDSPFVTPGYLPTLGLRLLGGRYLADSDDAKHPPVTIVNEAFVRHFCGGSVQSCIGRLMTSGQDDGAKPDTQIVGVVSDYRHEDVSTPPAATWFRPLRQNTKPAWLYYYVRTQAAPAGEMSLIRRAVREIDSSLPMDSFRTMDDQIEYSLGNQRTISMLAIAFGVLAVSLAGVGLYGVLAYATARRTREIGIRIALGSSRLKISWMVFADVLLLVGIAVAVALPCAWLFGRIIRAQLYNVAATDPLVTTCVSFLVALVACLAALLPALRAASINPSEALRAE